MEQLRSLSFLCVTPNREGVLLFLVAHIRGRSFVIVVAYIIVLYLIRNPPSFCYSPHQEYQRKYVSSYIHILDSVIPTACPQGSQSRLCTHYHHHYIFFFTPFAVGSCRE